METLVEAGSHLHGFIFSSLRWPRTPLQAQSPVKEAVSLAFLISFKLGFKSNAPLSDAAVLTVFSVVGLIDLQAVLPSLEDFGSLIAA
ncbi:hypothetical protein L1987_66951 [Smallanthus sonchifolius]|uniref:Uncharacterized protein n=1 Tax=Smallanthus sonchifolius TaxID=185202 RepID=A0ACB9BYJ8_9ASTR|nr:hypothetical protein L1987_66951 [Smallanthus sonchifolius]